MNLKVEFSKENCSLSLVGYKRHTTLYKRDLEDIVSFDSTTESFTDRVHSLFNDMLNDEYGYEDVYYNGNDVGNACKVIFPILKAELENKHTDEEKKQFFAQKEKAQIISKLRHWKLTNPSSDWLYNNLGCKYEGFFSKTPKYDKYITIINALKEYIEENYLELQTLSEEELKERYMKFVKDSL